jgi:hypothetical protein
MRYFSTVFGPLLNMLPRNQFEHHVAKSKANYYTKHFTTWCQLLVNLYAQASGKKSLRDIETGLRVQQHAWYHLGLTNISRSHLAYVNAKRDWRIFEFLFYQLLAQCREVTPKHRFRFKNPLQVLDATVIDLCLAMFPWAKFRTTKGALKLHALLDLNGTIPSFVVVTDAKQHERTVAKAYAFPLFPDSIVVMDKAYIDFSYLESLTRQQVYFVIRAKANMTYPVVGQQQLPQNQAVIADHIITLTGPLTTPKYPDKLRLVTFYDHASNRTFQYLTNHFQLAAATIAHIYQARWQIERFFKGIKQHLKIKTFLGTSPNAVLTQIWTAMIYYLLLAYIKYQTKYAYSLLYFTRVIRETLFRRTDIIDLLHLSPIRLHKLREPCYQLSLFG